MTQTNTLRAWILAARPKTLIAAVAPILIGAAVAFRDGHFAALNFTLALASALCIQIATNFSNDYYDFKKGADSGARIGPMRVTQAGLIAPHVVRNAFIACFAIAALLGAYLVYDAGWWVMGVGTLSILCGLAYTAGPWPLAYVGLGEIFVMIFFGPVATGFTYYVIAHEFSPLAFVVGLCPGAISCAILVANNLRDVDEDTKSAKRTLAVRFGTAFAKREYLFFWALAFGTAFYLAARWGGFNWLLPLLTLPLALKLSAQVMGNQDPRLLIKVLEGTAKSYALFALLLCVGLVL